MNNCLADLSRLIPPEYLKKGRGRVEKTEIIEMAIRHLKFLQERANGLYHGLAHGPSAMVTSFYYVVCGVVSRTGCQVYFEVRM